MLKQFAGSLKLHRQTPLTLLLWLFGFFLFGFGTISFILAFDNTAVSWGTLGTIFGAIGIVVFAIICFFSYHQDFMIALSMGRTRKEFMITYAAEQLIWMSAAYLSLVLMAWLESWLYSIRFPHAFEEVSLLPFLLDWRIAVPAILAMVIIPMFLGAMYSRFGKRFGVILYFLWLGSCLIPPRVIGHFEEMDAATQQGIMAVFGWIMLITPTGWICIGAVVLLAMVITTVYLGMKQMVR